MQIVTAREFRANQRKYFDLAERETVFVTRRSGRPISIRVASDDEIPTPLELESIKRGLDEIRRGETYTFHPEETFDDFLNRIEANV